MSKFYTDLIAKNTELKVLDSKPEDKIISIKLIRFDTMKQAEKWLEKNQKAYVFDLKIGLHAKDGFVVFYEKEMK